MKAFHEPSIDFSEFWMDFRWIFGVDSSADYNDGVRLGLMDAKVDGIVDGIKLIV